MYKNAHCLKKAVKSPQGRDPESRRPPALLLPLIDIDLSKCVSSVKPFHYFEK